MSQSEVPGAGAHESARCDRCGMSLEPSRVVWSCGLCKHRHEAT